MAEPDWSRGNCHQQGFKAFFGDGTRGGGVGVTTGKKACEGCVLRDECLEYALDNGINFGVWGGTSERQRRRIRRDRRQAQSA